MRLKKSIKLFGIAALVLLVWGCSSASKRQLKCNLHVIELMDARRIYLPNTTANGIDTYLKKSPDWKQIARLKNKRLDHAAAYKAARKGKTVLATYHSGSSKTNGHIVMVYGKKRMQWSNGFKASVPYVSGSVQGRRATISLLSNQFSSNKEPKMNYFIYQGK